jgi:hypothetical protein
LVELLAVSLSCDVLGEEALGPIDSNSGSNVHLETPLVQAAIISDEGLVHPVPRLRIVRRMGPRAVTSAKKFAARGSVAS